MMSSFIFNSIFRQQAFPVNPCFIELTMCQGDQIIHRSRMMAPLRYHHLSRPIRCNKFHMYVPPFPDMVEDWIERDSVSDWLY